MITSNKINIFSIEYKISKDIVLLKIKKIENDIRKEKNLIEDSNKWGVVNKMLIEVRLRKLLKETKISINKNNEKKKKIYLKW